MRIVKVYGGIGNALFQLCMALRLRTKLSADVRLDLSGLGGTLSDMVMELGRTIEPSFAPCGYGARLSRSGIVLPGMPRHRELKLLAKLGLIYFETEWGSLPTFKYKYYWGYFQRFDLASQFKDSILTGIKAVLRRNEYQTEVSPSSDKCFVHIRRGDYLTDNTIRFHGTLTNDYYLNAIRVFSERSFDFFSNDIEWVQSQFPMGPSDHVIDSKSGGKYDDLYEMYLMSRYSSAIIANSTFSYWAALLSNGSEKEVMMPKKWFTDPDLQKKSVVLRPENWSLL